MAAPETQFQQPGLTVPALTPSVYHPSAVNVPTGAGELWAQVGKNAMYGAAQVFDTLMKSPLNPTIKAQMEENKQRALYGADIIDHVRKLGEKGYLLGGEGPEGAYVRAPVEAGKAFPYFQPKPPTTGNEPKAPSSAPGTGSEPQEATKPATDNQPAPQQQYPTITSDQGGPPPPQQPQQQPPPPQQKPKIDPEHPPASIQDLTSASTSPRTMFAANAPRAPGPDQFQGPTQAQTSAAVQEALSRNRVASSAPGVPAGYQPPPQPQQFMNPATGSFEPIQQPAQPQQQPAQPQQQAPPPQPAPPPQAGAADLAAWQAQNVHPVASPAAVLKWYKDNVSTQAKGITYSPSGGANGEPGFVVHNTNGDSMISVSQIAKTPSGRALLSQQNPSELLEHQDNQAQAAAAQAQPPQAAQPQAQPQAPQGGAPPAPGQYPTITSEQGGLQGAPGTSYDPRPYQEAIRQATANPLNLTASTEGAGMAAQPAPIPLSDSEKADLADPAKIQAARDNAKVQANQPTNAPNEDGTGGDPSMGDLGPYHLYRDDRNRTGELYAIRPGLSTLFKQQRYYLGSDGWQEYELPNTNMRLNMEAEYGGGKGGFGGHGNAPVFNHDQIANMSVPAMQKWLALANDYHQTGGEFNAPAQQDLEARSEASKVIQRLIDLTTVAKRLNMSEQSYNRQELEYNVHAGELESKEPPGGWQAEMGRFGSDILHPEKIVTDPREFFGRPGRIMAAAKAAWEAAQSGGRIYNPLSAAMKEEVNRLNSALVQVKGVQDILPSGSAEEKSVPLSASGSIGYGMLSGSINTRIPMSPEQESVYREINRLFERGDQEDTLNGLKELQGRFNRAYQDSYVDAANHNYRLNPKNVADYNMLQHNLPMVDKNSEVKRDAQGNVLNPYRNWPRPGQTSNLPPEGGPPTITNWDTGQEELKRRGYKKGDIFIGPDKQQHTLLY